MQNWIWQWEKNRKNKNRVCRQKGHCEGVSPPSRPLYRRKALRALTNSELLLLLTCEGGAEPGVGVTTGGRAGVSSEQPLSAHCDQAGRRAESGDWSGAVNGWIVLSPAPGDPWSLATGVTQVSIYKGYNRCQWGHCQAQRIWWIQDGRQRGDEITDGPGDDTEIS